jgi:DNA repair photolyase
MKSPTPPKPAKPLRLPHTPDPNDARKAQAPTKGRGAASRPASRFHTQVRVARTMAGVRSTATTSWMSPRAPQTTVSEERARSIISHNSSPDVGFDSSINPYRGCEHGCVYCFARPSHAYLDLSPGLDFETEAVRQDQRGGESCARRSPSPGYRVSPIALGINTDGWQPIERDYGLTRGLLEVLCETRHPAHIVTKGALITRDLDLLSDMARDGLVHVHLSITTLDNKLSAKLEPRASAPHTRLKAVRALHEAGVPVGVLVAPVIPMVTDHMLEAILEEARAAGAGSAGYVLMRLPHELKQLFREWLELHFPERAAHVMSLMQQMHGGKDYDSAFGQRMKGSGVFADLLKQRFRKAHARLGYGSLPPINCEAFVAPRKPSPQGSLF